MLSKRDKASLLDIVKAARKILKFKRNLDRSSFLEDDKTQSAIIYQLLIIGEAVKRLSPAFRQCYPEIPWPLMAGMRDNLIHEYDDVDLEEVWTTSDRDVPNLLSLLEPLIPKEEQL
jgi:uncharacterized protein with HEPN domain